MPETKEEKTSASAQNWWQRNLITFVIVTIALLAIFSIQLIPDKDTTVESTVPPPVNVSVEIITPLPTLADTFILPGVIEPNRIVTVSAEVSGRIDQIPVKEGDSVQSGQTLVQINTELLKPTYDMAQAQVKRDRIVYERMQDLVQNKATSQQDLDDAGVKLTISIATLAEIQARLERTSITSPCTGILNELFIEPGEYIDLGKPVAQIVDTQTVVAVVAIPERDISFFAKGQTAKIQADIRGIDQSFTGTISYISEIANAQTRSTRVEMTLDNAKQLLRSGQIVRIELTRRNLEQAIMIPLRAVIPMEEGHAVYVVEGSQSQRRLVTMGILQGDQIQITTGLQAGDQLIVKGQRFVAPGQPVTRVSESQ